MAIMAILLTMIVSFSVLMNRQAVSHAGQYTFATESIEIREAIEEWIAEKDTEGTVITVKEGSLEAGGEALFFRAGVLSNKDTEYKETDDVFFYVTENEKLIKCVLCRESDEGDIEERAYVFSLRAATAVGEGT